MDYSQHKLEDYQCFERFAHERGKAELFSFIDRVYGRLMKMNVGDVYNLRMKVSDKNLELFIKTACLFMLDGNNDYRFDDAYTSIVRIPKPDIHTMQSQMEAKREKIAMQKTNIS